MPSGYNNPYHGDFSFVFGEGVRVKHERFLKFSDDQSYYYAFCMFDTYSRTSSGRDYITREKFRIGGSLFTIRFPLVGDGFSFIYKKCDSGDYPLELIDIEEV